jgi:hypothetical protein
MLRVTCRLFPVTNFPEELLRKPVLPDTSEVCRVRLNGIHDRLCESRQGNEPVGLFCELPIRVLRDNLHPCLSHWIMWTRESVAVIVTAGSEKRF